MADETEVPQTTTGTDVDATPTEGEQQMDVEAPNGTEKPEENGAEEALVEASKRSREGEEGEGAEEGEGENGAAKKHKSEMPADEGLEQDEEKEGPEDAEGGGGGEEYVEGGGGGGGGGEEYVEGGGGGGGEEGEGEGGEEEEGHEEGYEEGMEEVKEGGAPADVPADGPTKESTPVSLGPKVFKTSVEMFDYFIKLLHYWPPNVDVNKVNPLAPEFPCDEQPFIDY